MNNGKFLSTATTGNGKTTSTHEIIGRQDSKSTVHNLGELMQISGDTDYQNTIRPF